MRTRLMLLLLVPGLMAGSVTPLAQTQPSQAESATPIDIAQGPRVEGELFEYSTGGKTYQGYLAHNVNDGTARPAVLVVHEWWGLNDYARARADQLAALGFVALAVDMYGDGQATTHPDQAGALAGDVMQDWPATRARLEAAMTRLREHPAVADSGMAAIGYCLGGSVVMNMALSGMPIEAAISFHGDPSAMVSTPQAFAGLVQIHNGAEDPLVESADLDAMATALEAQGASVEVVNYPNALHGFTNPHADAVAEEYGLPLGYDAAADAASWQAALLALDRSLNGD